MIGLNRGEDEGKYTVRLYFAEPVLEPAEVDQEGKKKGGPKRVFDVEIQDKLVLDNFNVVEEAGAKLRTVVRSFKNVAVSDTLKIRLRRTTEGTYPAILNGVEIIAEE